MSAAEKLRALEPWLAKGSSREVIALVDALPQIVAVVEAAEAWAGISADLGSIEAGEVPSESEVLHLALAALDEALSDDLR